MRTTFYLFMATLILGSLFIFFTPQEKTSEPEASIPPELTDSDKAATNYRFEIDETGLISGPDIIRTRQGESIELAFSSTIDDELHLHGYDLHLELKPGKTSVLKLNLDRSGRFEYELHDRHIELGALEVLPR